MTDQMPLFVSCMGSVATYLSYLFKIDKSVLVKSIDSYLNALNKYYGDSSNITKDTLTESKEDEKIVTVFNPPKKGSFGLN